MSAWNRSAASNAGVHCVCFENQALPLLLGAGITKFVQKSFGKALLLGQTWVLGVKTLLHFASDETSKAPCPSHGGTDALVGRDARVMSSCAQTAAPSTDHGRHRHCWSTWLARGAWCFLSVSKDRAG